MALRVVNIGEIGKSGKLEYGEEVFYERLVSTRKGDGYSKDVFEAKRENNCMFLTSSKFKFLDLKNYIEPGL